jgi:hypothetical protein
VLLSGTLGNKEPLSFSARSSLFIVTADAETLASSLPTTILGRPRAAKMQRMGFVSIAQPV